MTKSPEHALLLLEKADEDLFTIRQLAKDPRSPHAVIGFHAQQAVEKSLKAVLTSRGIRFPWTHDLASLLDLLADQGIPTPPDAESLPVLTPFAAEFRYGSLPREGAAEPLDRRLALDIAERTREWARRATGGT